VNCEDPVEKVAMPIESSCAEEETRRLLESPKLPDVGLGLVLAACELCTAYRGAELVPCRTLTRTHHNMSLASKCPARFSGTITFAGDCAESAICWVSAGVLTKNKPVVDFAMLSPTAVAISRVTLARSSKKDDGSAAQMFAGISCESVEPIAVSCAGLTPFKPHPVVLRVTSSGAEIATGGVTVSHSLETSPGDVHIWCLRWNSTDESGDVGPCDALSIELEVAPEPAAPQVTPAATPRLNPGATLRAAHAGRTEKPLVRTERSRPDKKNLAEDLASR